MDENFKHILDSLAEKPPRSRLEPYADLIDELRLRGRTYRDIASILTERCMIKTSRSTINDFVRQRTRAKRESRKPRKPASAQIVKIGPAEPRARPPARHFKMSNGSPAEVRRRIAALKERPAPTQEKPYLFQYDPDEPLHLPPDSEKCKDSG